MKTISLEIDERVYTQVVSFLRLLPGECCHVFEEDDTALDMEELATVKAIQARLQAGDDSDFVDWDDIKDKL